MQQHSSFKIHLLTEASLKASTDILLFVLEIISVHGEAENIKQNHPETYDLKQDSIRSMTTNHVIISSAPSPFRAKVSLKFTSKFSQMFYISAVFEDNNCEGCLNLS
ncbi:hypothetical protein EGR_08089 [Echinococcus granulosus]|uniref:Uncharacterized protein n=1 Tax=Echinococcus granulosus TaxID=6210 RepID=W6U7C3_ECHGR|nr:hypothetical protein EGR_08089 [Echinococcus granulosus]EUB57080.1 hypothetical protein EGR_08089 [Echinococcus granulosus]